ncbi:MAG: pyridoxamine 5'-phosphate oxidase [Bacteroidales bacterium]|jgi:pyridoxamine 5'-phosphate oxidase|nr:pyridoxamine 5'-phosphate oxidase [Bacteroidales bacterium]
MAGKDLSDMRRDYIAESIAIENLNPDPFQEFSKWFENAVKVEQIEVNAMVLSTSSVNGQPSSRVVLLKSFTTDGFLFFTNYNSKKGREISENNRVALLLFWPKSMRQIRIEGVAGKIDPKESDRYFMSRPVENRASACLSQQSSILENRDDFDNRVVSLTQSNKEIKRPEHWGGYVVKPSSFEFWQGGTGRAHDRFLYKRDGKSWKIVRLYP